MRTRTLLTTGAGLALICLAGCGDMPEDDPGATARVTLVAMLEPGDAGEQAVLLTRPVDLDVPLNDSTTFVGGAELRLRHIPGSEEIVLTEDAARWRYIISRAEFPLVPGDSVVLGVAGAWEGREFAGEAGTRIVSPEGLAFSRKPGDRSHGYDADTLMFYDPGTEADLANPTAFFVDWEQSCGDGCDYQYQLEFEAVVRDSLVDRFP